MFSKTSFFCFRFDGLVKNHWSKSDTSNCKKSLIITTSFWHHFDGGGGSLVGYLYILYIHQHWRQSSAANRVDVWVSLTYETNFNLTSELYAQSKTIAFNLQPILDFELFSILVTFFFCFWNKVFQTKLIGICIHKFGKVSNK